MSVLEGKVVIVTGAGRGIGRGIALGAAAAGAKVVVCDQGGRLQGGHPDARVAEAAAAEINAAGGEAVAAGDTVATMDGARRIVGAALEAWGRVDGLVCCAGIVRHGPFLELSESDFDDVVAVHLKGHFTMFHSTLAAMVGNGNGGSLIGISSAYSQGDADRAAYRSAKAGIVALTKSAALAGEAHGVRANVISPMANSRMTKASDLQFDSEPEDIAPMAVYLLSDRSKGLSGQVFSVAGRTISCWEDPHERRTARSEGRWTQDGIDGVVPWLREGARQAGGGSPPLPEDWRARFR